MTNLLNCMLFVVVAIAAVRPDVHFVVDILENGARVKQDVTIKDDLQIIHVPAHRDLVEIEMYIDFKNDLQLVKLIDENKCQLSKIDPGIVQISFSAVKTQTTPLESFAMEHKRFVRLESSEALDNLTYLRYEMQAACNNLSIFWVESVEENVYYSKRLSRNTLSVGDNKYQFPPYTKQAPSLSCPHDGGMIGPQPVCHPNCFYQICNPNGGSWCFYTATHCTMVSPTCWSHISNMPVNCRPCCSSPNVTCGTQLPYCGCYANGHNGK